MKKRMSKYSLLAMVTLLCASSGAQQKHEVAIYGMGGFSMLNAKFEEPFSIKDKGNFGGGVGASYAFNLDERFAILSGVEVTLNNSKIKSDNIDGNYIIEDYYHGDRAKFSYQVSNYKEDIKYTYINIPVMVRYSHSLTQKVGLYVSVGAKVGFKAKATYDNQFGEMATSATYGELGNGIDDPIINNLPELGFGLFENGKSDGAVNMKTAISSSLELGTKYNVCQDRNLYVGLYFDCTFNNVLEQGNSLFVKYDQTNPSEIMNGSIAQSYNKAKSESTTLTRSFRPMNVGLKVQFSFNL